MNKRIILITGSTETLGYFSKQIAAYLREKSIEVFIWNMLHPLDSSEAFDRLENPEDSILVTFNFIGLLGEGQFAYFENNIWDHHGIEKIVIMVDSPIYYFKQLNLHIPNMRCICIDLNHAVYMKKWHSEYGEPAFIPLMGNLPIDDKWYIPGVQNDKERQIILGDYTLKPLKKRPLDIVFIGNYVGFDSLFESISELGPEYKDMLMETADYLIDNPKKALEEVLENRLREIFPDEEEDAYPVAMHHMIFVDLYIRSYFRAKMITSLAEEGYKIHCVGQDWDKADTYAPLNIIRTPEMMSSAECLEALQNAKISLNIMPWFKAGAHDRLFSSMLAGCVSVSDSSEYINSKLTAWKEYAPFDISDMNSVIKTIDRLHSDSELSDNIAKFGRKRAICEFTWKNFTDELIALIS